MTLPESPSLDWLRKQAKRRLAELRREDGAATLSQAQFAFAREYGFSSWRVLKAHVDSLTVEGRLFASARSGDVAALEALLEEHPDKLLARSRPHGWTLLHQAAHDGQLGAVDLLLRHGLDPNEREQGDNTYALHWAAAAGHLDVVRRLADAGGDVVGAGDDHELEVIGWATCWDGDEAVQRAVAEFVAGRGARHHLFSAIAVGDAGEVRRIVAADRSALTRPMSRHENHQLPLHFAVRRNRPEMVELLLELGADPAARDGLGMPAAVYAAAPEVDPAVVEILAAHGAIDVFGALVLGDDATAAELLARDGGLDALHLVAKRGNVRAARWLLERGADPNARRSHWDAEVTPLHLASAHGHADVVRVLLAAGADPAIRDSKHGGDAVGWAASGRVPPAPNWREIVRMLEEHVNR